MQEMRTLKTLTVHVKEYSEHKKYTFTIPKLLRK